MLPVQWAVRDVDHAKHGHKAKAFPFLRTHPPHARMRRPDCLCSAGVSLPPRGQYSIQRKSKFVCRIPRMGGSSKYSHIYYKRRNRKLKISCFCKSFDTDVMAYQLTIHSSPVETRVIYCRGNAHRLLHIVILKFKKKTSVWRCREQIRLGGVWHHNPCRCCGEFPAPGRLREGSAPMRFQ